MRTETLKRNLFVALALLLMSLPFLAAAQEVQLGQLRFVLPDGWEVVDFQDGLTDKKMQLKCGSRLISACCTDMGAEKPEEITLDEVDAMFMENVTLGIPGWDPSSAKVQNVFFGELRGLYLEGRMEITGFEPAGAQDFYILDGQYLYMLGVIDGNTSLSHKDIEEVFSMIAEPVFFSEKPVYLDKNHQE